MGTMRNNFAGASVIVILMLSTSQSLPLDGNENSSKRNSLPDALTLDPRSTSSSIYECLFIDPDLPLCDLKWMLNSDKESPDEQNFFDEDVLQRSRRNVDVSTMDVVVYTIDGCLPLRLPFSMPSCEGISLNRIVDIQRFRPFAMKGVTKPPFVFPEFNYPQWLRMMTRLRNHVSSKTREEEQHAIIPGKISSDNSIQARTDDTVNTAATKETTPNAMAANVNILKGSSPNRLVPGTSSKPVESMELQSNESDDCFELNSYGQRIENVQNPRTIPEIPAIPGILDIPAIPLDQGVYGESMNLEPSNEFVYHDDSRNSLLNSNKRVRETDNGIENDFLPLGTSLGIFRQKREIRMPAPSQKISEESKAHGIAGKSPNQHFVNGFERSSSRINRVDFPGMYKKKSKSLKFNEHGIAVTEDVPTIAIPRPSTESHVTSVSEDSREKIDALEGTKAMWRKSMSKETTSRKKYRKHVKL